MSYSTIFSRATRKRTPRTRLFALVSAVFLEKQFSCDGGGFDKSFYEHLEPLFEEFGTVVLNFRLKLTVRTSRHGGAGV